MSSVQEMQRTDLELFLALMESLINPAFLQMSSPLKGYDPMFYFQINMFITSFYIVLTGTEAQVVSTKLKVAEHSFCACFCWCDSAHTQG